jgi:hypothetical protein
LFLGPVSSETRPDFVWEAGVASKLVLVGGKKPQMRKARAQSWSKEKEAEFLSVLAETCNVTQACERAGVSVGHAYRKRKTDAAFRAGWLEAIGTAYQRLELVLLDRAFNGVEKVVTRRDGSEERMVEYSNQLAMSLLKMHRDTAAEASADMPAEDLDELRKRLIGKLERLKKRKAAARA